MEEHAVYLAALAIVTSWAQEVNAGDHDPERNRVVAEVIAGVRPHLNRIAEYASDVLIDPAVAADAAYAQRTAARVLRGELLPAGHLTFFEASPEPVRAGDVGGDHQHGDAWSRRFTALRGDGLFAALTVVFYVAPDSASGEGPAVLWRQEWYDVCENPGQLDDAAFSDIRDYRASGYTEAVPADAYDACADLPRGAVVWPESMMPL